MTTFIGGVHFINDWNRSTTKWINIDRILHDEITSLLVDAATQGVNIAKHLVETLYPPASSPGEPPRQRTGMLRDSIDIQHIERFMVEWGSNLDYSFYLERGTSKMLPRPHMLPASMEVSQLFPDLLFRRFLEVTA